MDANRGYGVETLRALLPVLVEAEVALLEQPLARGREADEVPIIWSVEINRPPTGITGNGW